MDQKRPLNSYREIFLYFLRLGAVGFGGPLSLVAQMQTELIEERQWQSKEEFAQALTLIKAMPGPLAFGTACFLGHKRGGFWGSLIAGWTLILPAFLMMWLLAAQYDNYAKFTSVSTMLLGMQASALAIIATSIWSLAKPYYRNYFFLATALTSLFLVSAGISEPLLILGCGFFHIFIDLVSRKLSSNHVSSLKLLVVAPSPIHNLEADKLYTLILTCLKAGALVFGTGLAMIPVLERVFVTELNWIQPNDFVRAVAFGQMTPGPVLITVTFLGYKVLGFKGAIAATLSIFFPTCFHMSTWFPLVTGWLSRQKWIPFFTRGAMAAVIGSLLFVVGKLSLEQIINSRQYVLGFIALGSAILILVKKTQAWLLILGSGLLALAITQLGF